jgi:hypothetical protein
MVAVWMTLGKEGGFFEFFKNDIIIKSRVGDLYEEVCELFIGAAITCFPNYYFCCERAR